ncbi:VWA domain-containing protein [Jiella pelagia]|uniref:VWA domain-containing protein n=1 Tax=Jiella pelagia TaxID=2986949 RepID=A0ABY7C098_9HYPH|nr:VWA domain-containing protein [Jiella pelagia]WAP69162.1 VWA domain-containing protein [Jiella pelagia]
MIALAFDNPLWLLGLPLAALPFAAPVLAPLGHPRRALAPLDTASKVVSILLPLLGAVAVTLLLLSLAGLHRTDQTITREGRGAQLMLLIDRSSSMDNSFAGRRPDGAEESKAMAARRLLSDFVDRRPHDRLGVAMFSTSPMLAVPLTDHRTIVKAAIATMGEHGLAQTNVGRGLALAIGAFDGATAKASRAVVLVSDGAGVISRDVQANLRDLVGREPVNLYWLFLRTEGAKSIFEVPKSGERDTPQARPERHLHLFLQSLGVPYRAFEAENSEAVEAAIDEIDTLEARPILYEERVPRRDLSRLLHAGTALSILLLVLAKLAQRDRLSSARMLAPIRPAEQAR